MQKILGYMRRACQEFDLIEDGDKIAVGVSGGKDSLVLLCGLAEMRRFYEKKYDICAHASAARKPIIRPWQGSARNMGLSLSL